MFCFLLGLKSIHVTFLSLRFIDYFVHISSTRRWINADLLLYHRLRRWPNIKAALVKRQFSVYLAVCFSEFHARYDLYTTYRPSMDRNV